MTQSDKWKKRPPVVKYFEYANTLKSLDIDVKWEPLSLHFVMPMPKSWSKKKKAEMIGKPHKQKPDLDNLIKAFQDAVLKEDSIVWIYGTMMKTWGENGCITVDTKEVR